MKMLVTGGTGFIGSRLALEARALGWDLVIAGQLNTPAERARAAELEQAGIRIEQGGPAGGQPHHFGRPSSGG